jgi:general secretion pathway protein M
VLTQNRAMLKLGREQVIALAALVALLLGCTLAVGLSIATRSGALQELADRQEMLSRLQIKVRQRADSHGRLIAGKAPTAALLDAPTAGLASAQLQTYIARVVSEQRAVLASSGVESAARDDAADTIRVQATLELNLKSLQAMLYQLESGLPYVFVETLALQPSNAGQFADDPHLRVTIGVRALWRRGSI